MKKRTYKVETIYDPVFTDGKYVRCITCCKIVRDKYIGSIGCELCNNFVDKNSDKQTVQCNGQTLLERLFRNRFVV